MKTPGFCTECHWVKQVRVSPSGLGRTPSGICDTCQEKMDARGTKILTVYVPAADSALRRTLLPGSALVGSLSNGRRIMVDFEGDKYGSQGLRTYEQKLLHASGRHVERYPTVARAFVESGDLIEVGTYDVHQRTLTVTDPQALKGWTDEHS